MVLVVPNSLHSWICCPTALSNKNRPVTGKSDNGRWCPNQSEKEAVVWGSREQTQRQEKKDKHKAWHLSHTLILMEKRGPPALHPSAYCSLHVKKIKSDLPNGPTRWRHCNNYYKEFATTSLKIKCLILVFQKIEKSHTRYQLLKTCQFIQQYKNILVLDNIKKTRKGQNSQEWIITEMTSNRLFTVFCR